MKKFFACILAVCCCFSFFSCGLMPDMRELLSYQKDGASFRVKIHDGDEFYAVITLGQTNTVELLDDEETEGIRFLFGENEASVEYGDTTMPIPNTDKLKAEKWVSLFALSADALWKISRDTTGGISVYVCSCHDITLYIDAASRLPLKMISGTTEIDVLSCE